MSRERELLLVALDYLCTVGWGEADRFAIVALVENIKELLAQPEQEPVGVVRTIGGYPDNSEHVVDWVRPYKYLKDGDRLYTAPPKREPIEDGELEVWYSQHTWAMDKQEYMWGFRDAEKAHGIGEG